MAHLALRHPTRGDLTFRQAQTDEYTRDAVANITAEIGTDRPPLVHTETREATREIRGRLTAPRRARNDPDTNDWRQALANYADLLESHVDEFQGDGYTLDDEILAQNKSAILESVGWELSPGQPYEFQFDATVQLGRGVFEDGARSPRTPTVNESLPTMIRVDGVECPGMRRYAMNRSIGTDPTAVFDRSSAENNDIVTEEGVQQQFVFEGTHTGPRADRRQADDALSALAPTKESVTLETLWPGYDVDGFVTNYTSNFEARFGSGRHDYRIEFVIGERA